MTIGNSKAGHDIPIPLSAAIARALKIARDHAKPNADGDSLIFPECSTAGHRDPLPARGHAMRRTWKTIATNCAVPDDMSACRRA